MSKKNKEPMNFQFALFNGHVNDAFKKAKKAFIQSFGQAGWDKHIEPFSKKGIMSILQDTPTKETLAYVFAVSAFVNEDCDSVRGN